MIITVTMNPSLDVLYQLNTFKLGKTNRASKVSKMVGGKGINTSRVVTLLGEENIALGLIAGTNGQIIQDTLNEEQVPNRMLSINGESRNSITIIHDNNVQTEINESGPNISLKDLEMLKSELFNLLTQHPDAFVSIAGRIYIEQTDIYAKWLTEIKDVFPNAKVVIDTSGAALEKVLLGDAKPYFIKPNIDELSELVNYTVTSDPLSISKALTNPLFDGVYGILVSLGPDGAFALVDNQPYLLKVPDIPIKNPTGSGDSTVAGILYGLQNQLKIEDTLKHAMACGVANAVQEKTGFINVIEERDLFSKIIIE